MYRPLCWQVCDHDQGRFKKLMRYEIMKEFNCKATFTWSNCDDEKEMAVAQRQIGKDGKGRPRPTAIKKSKNGAGKRKRANFWAVWRREFQRSEVGGQGGGGPEFFLKKKNLQILVGENGPNRTISGGQTPFSAQVLFEAVFFLFRFFVFRNPQPTPMHRNEHPHTVVFVSFLGGVFFRGQSWSDLCGQSRSAVVGRGHKVGQSRCHHVGFLQSYGHGNLQLSACRARSNAVDSCDLSVQPNQTKAQSFQLRSSVFSPDCTVGTAVTPVFKNSPKHLNLQLDRLLVNSVFGCH